MEYLAMSTNTSLDVKWAKVEVLQEHFTRKQHYNPNYELIAVTEGPLYLQVEDEKLTLNAGDIVLLLPWEQHKGWRPDLISGSFFWVQFQSSISLDPMSSESLSWEWKKHLTESSKLRTISDMDGDLLALPRRALHVPHKFKLLRYFEQLIGEMDEMEGNYRYRASLLLGSILEMISNVVLEKQKAIQPVSQSYRIYQKTVSFLDNFFMEDLKRATIESQLNRKYEYIGQLFKNYSGISIVDYIQQLRVQRSKYLLLHTQKTIKEISEEVGFEDAFYFSKVFRKKEGVAPSQFRSNSKNNQEFHE